MNSAAAGNAGYRRRRGIVLAIYVVLLCTDVALTNWDDLFGKEQCDSVSLTTRMWYQRLVTLGYRKPRPHLTRLILVDSPPGHAFSACERRAYLAELLNKLSEFRPAIIVLDYSFVPRNDCTHNETFRVQEAVDRLAISIPVVFGSYSWTEQELQDEGQTVLFNRLKGQLSKQDQVIAESDVQPHGSLAVLGLDRLDCDTRRVPVMWHGRLYDTAGKNVGSYPTISFASAQAYDDAVALRVANIVSNKQNPFTSFMPEDDFRPIRSSVILTGPVPPDKWNLASKILVVGEEGKDNHESVLGRVPGVVLQANYIEALLDDRYFLGLGKVWTPIVTFCCLLIITMVFERSKTAMTAISVAVCFWVVLLLVSYIAFVHFAVLFTAWVPSFFGIVTGLVVKLREA